MNVFIKSLLLSPAVLVAMSAFGQATDAKSYLRNPFDVQPRIVDSPKAEALLAQLSRAETSKSQRSFLMQLALDDGTDFLVEFNNTAPRLAPGARFNALLAERKSKLADVKQRVASQVGNDSYKVLTRYDALEFAHVRLKNWGAVVKLLKDPNVRAIYPNIHVKKALNESLPLIQQPFVASTGKLGAGTTVAVLDSGVDYRRPEFGNCVTQGLPASCRVVAAFDAAPEDNMLDDATSHGTGVAAVVAAVAPGANIAAIDVFNKPNGADVSDILAGINWAVTYKSYYNIVAMNLSLGVGTTSATCPEFAMPQIFATAVTAGIVPVVATGNSAAPNGVGWPACSPGAVAVGAVYDASSPGPSTWNVDLNQTCTDTVTMTDKVACFSNGGNLVTLLAPGAMINAGGEFHGGTSFAAPHVAGAVAVLRANNGAPGELVADTVARMVNTGQMVTDHRTGIQKPRLNLSAAMASLTPSGYHALVQRLYIAYVGRPADPASLDSAATALMSSGAPATVSGLNGAYNSNSSIRILIESLSNSAESQSVYASADTATYVSTVYRTLFNREPAAGGLNFWTDQINGGTVTRARAPLAIYEGALTGTSAQAIADAAAAENKAAVAGNFTRIVDTAREVHAYKGSAAATQARQLITNVTASTDQAVYQSTVASTLASIVAATP